MAATLAACGTSHSAPQRAVMLNPAAVVDPLIDQTSASILRHATTDTEAAAVVHVKGTGVDSGHTLTFDVSIAGTHGCNGTVAESGEGSLQLVSDGTVVWLKPDKEFWQVAANVTDPAELAKVDGKYITASASDPQLGQIVSFCQLKSLLKGFSSNNTQGEIKNPVTRLNGERVLKVSDTADAAYVVVSDAAQPRLLQLIDPASGGFRFTFGYPDTAPAVVPPPAGQVISTGQ